MHTKPPLISVLMPTYNVENYIADSIESILAQTYKHWELIIVNDGSADNTENIARHFAEKDERIKLANQTENKGLIETRNHALSLANGAFIAILDSDDIAFPNRLKEQVDFLLQNPDFVLVGGACELIDSKGQKIGAEGRTIPNSHLSTLLLFSNYFINSTVLMRASALKNLKYEKGFAPSEDYHLFTKLAHNGKLANINKPLVKYRIHNQNTSQLKKAEQQQAVKEIFREQLFRLRVEPSDAQLNLHAKLVDGPFPKTISELNEIENWLNLILKSNNEIKIYPQDILGFYAAFFLRRACLKSNLGVKSISFFKNSSLYSFAKHDLKGNVKFLLKSIF
jgi:glycosyltransferase involved in cell wall biosynthesis